MKILNLASAFLAYLCIATVVAQGIGVGALWSRGMLDKEKTYRILGVVHDVKPPSEKEEQTVSDSSGGLEHISFSQIMEARMARSLNLDLRESAIEKAQGELRALETKLKNEREQYNQLKKSFDIRLEELQNVAIDTMLQDQQQTTEAFDPKIAKDILLEKLANDGLQRVVTIIKAMPLDKRKKLANAFKGEEELKRLYEIWDAMGTSTEEGDLIRDTSERLRQFDAKSP